MKNCKNTVEKRGVVKGKLHWGFKTSKSRRRQCQEGKELNSGLSDRTKRTRHERKRTGQKTEKNINSKKKKKGGVPLEKKGQPSTIQGGKGNAYTELPQEGASMIKNVKSRRLENIGKKSPAAFNHPLWKDKLLKLSDLLWF